MDGRAREEDIWVMIDDDEKRGPRGRRKKNKYIKSRARRKIPIHVHERVVRFRYITYTTKVIYACLQFSESESN